MKMRRYLASDMRQALKAVREAQGADAVILSTRRLANGVEVVAAIDYDEAEVKAASSGEIRVGGEALSALATRESSDPSGELGLELQRVRQMLETQLATLAWNDLTRRAPTQSEILKHLTEIGLSASIAAEVVSELPRGLELEPATHRAQALIAQRILTSPDRWLEHGGMVALVGPTGAGKTSAVAKLAAHWAIRHGSQSLALVSADNARLGAPEQIHILGRLLGVPAYSVSHPRELRAVLESLSDRRFVLIDTAGGTARDPDLEARLGALAAASPKIETALVLAASSQAGVLAEAHERFAAARPATCILTKLDEAVSLGGTLSLLVRTRLPVSYVSDGQRVPEDLAPARAHQLVVRALSARTRSAAWVDEELLQRRFGGVAHALA